MSAKRSKLKTKSQMIYCGPSLKGMKQFSIYLGDPPESVKKHLKNGAVKELFVNKEDFPVVRKNITLQGTRENQLYKKALQYAKGGK